MQFLHFYICCNFQLAYLSAYLWWLTSTNLLCVGVHCVYHLIMDENWWENLVHAMNEELKWVRETFSILPRRITLPNVVSSGTFTCQKEITRNIMSQRLSAALWIIYNQIEIIIIIGRFAFRSRIMQNILSKFSKSFRFSHTKPRLFLAWYDFII